MNVTVTVHIDTDGTESVATAVAARHLRRIPQAVHDAVRAALSVVEDQPAMSTGEIVADLAEAAVNAWEGTKPATKPKPRTKTPRKAEAPAPVEVVDGPELLADAAPTPLVSIEYQPSGWYWICTVGDDHCDEGHPETGGWVTEDRARVAGNFHIVDKHNGKGMAA